MNKSKSKSKKKNKRGGSIKNLKNKLKEKERIYNLEMEQRLGWTTNENMILEKKKIENYEKNRKNILGEIKKLLKKEDNKKLLTFLKGRENKNSVIRENLPNNIVEKIISNVKKNYNEKEILNILDQLN